MAHLFCEYSITLIPIAVLTLKSRSSNTEIVKFSKLNLNRFSHTVRETKPLMAL